VKQAEGITDFPSLSWEETLLSSSSITPTSDSFTPNSHLALSHQQKGQPDCAREGSPLPLLRGGMQLSRSRHLICGFVVLGLEGNSASSDSDHKPMGTEIALVPVKSA